MQDVSAAQAGIGKSQARCISAFEPLLGAVCRRYLRQRHDIEDAIQDTLVKMVLHGKDVSSPRLAGWLSSTAHTTCIDQLRRTASEERRRLALSRMTSIDEDETNQLDSVSSQMREALSRLDEPARQLLVERYYDTVPLHVIARRKGVSVSTVSRCGTAALAALAAILQEMGFTHPAEFSLASSRF